MKLVESPPVPVGATFARNSTSALAPLRLDNPIDTAAAQPLTLGVPFPRGALHDAEQVGLQDEVGRAVPCQQAALGHWSDGSVKWLLVDFVSPGTARGTHDWSLRLQKAEHHVPAMKLHESPAGVEVDTGVARFQIAKTGQLFRSVRVGECALAVDGELVLLDARGRRARPCVERWTWEARGPVRVTLRFDGRFKGRAPCRFVARLCFFAGTGLMRARLTIHNPNRARHRGNLWDLGDPGSILFRDCSCTMTIAGGETAKVRWQAEPEGPVAEDAGRVLIYQDSSGGDNWRSRNHVNRHGAVPCSFRGYRVRSARGEETGLRANPVLSVHSPAGVVSAAMPEFWQQFPKAIEARDARLRIGLFPGEFGDLFELQGGEQKTHTFWLHFGLEGKPALDWVHSPIVACADAEWIAAAKVIPHLAPAREPSVLDTFLNDAIDGPQSLFARREIIDEYGWRHFGEVYADHENAYFTGPKPVVSHFNNQYDMIQGGLAQYLRTGDCRWWQLADALARHVTDIDIYHTDRDRAAYSGGLFWITDHYKDAGTATHRTFSRTNCPPENPMAYGGGPGCEHSFTTGLATYYYLTGDTLAREAALSLANWVIRMDDGRTTLWGLIDDGPTGLASATHDPHYHGPGRGVGNSVNTLLDGWQLTGHDRYLEKAEELIRRAVHPEDNVAGRQLSNAELRWSYTVFLTTLDRYLRLKTEAGQADSMYAYARTSLLNYAKWMCEHERPYLDHPEQLEFPTETWAAQEFRKANVLRLAAQYAGEPLRGRLLQKGLQLADRAWADLLRFETRDSVRAIALVLADGARDAFFRLGEVDASPPTEVVHDFGRPCEFLPQRERVRRQLKTPGGLARALLSLVNPARWSRFLRSRR